MGGGQWVRRLTSDLRPHRSALLCSALFIEGEGGRGESEERRRGRAGVQAGVQDQRAGEGRPGE